MDDRLKRLARELHVQVFSPASRALLERPPVGQAMVWGYLKSELQALPLEPDHNYSIGRKLDSDLVLKVRRSRSCL